MAALPPALEPIAARLREAAVFADFDGTLSAIAPTPEAAGPVSGAVEALAALAGVARAVAVVSGRRAEEVARLLGAPPGVRCYGLYGLETAGGAPDPAAVGMARAVETVLPEVEALAAAVPGSRVEPKGFQVAIHYRGAEDPARARSAIVAGLESIARRSGLRVLEGKMVAELAPRHGPTKGRVVERVTAEVEAGAVVYAGDDEADLEAFAAVDRLAEAGLAAAKVAVRSNEAPERLISAADLVVEGPEDLVATFRAVAEAGA